MRAESGGLTMPTVVSSTTAMATNTAAIVKPIHQRKAANASGSSRRVARRHHRLWGVPTRDLGDLQPGRRGRHSQKRV